MEGAGKYSARLIFVKEWLVKPRTTSLEAKIRALIILFNTEENKAGMLRSIPNKVIQAREAIEHCFTFGTSLCRPTLCLYLIY